MANRQVTLPNGAVVTINDRGDIISGDPAARTTPTYSAPAPAPTASYSPPPTQTYSPAPTASKSYSPPSSNLQPGMTGDSVKQLQDWLVSQGYMTQTQVNTGYGTYGPQTTAAVAKWQQDNGVDNSTGPGYWGPRTIAKATGSSPASSSAPAPSDPAKPDMWSSVYSADPFTSKLLEDPAKKSLFDAMPDEMKSAWLQAASALSKAVESGKVVNPNIQITPDQLKQFYDKAATELDPHYTEQFNTLRGGLDLSLARMTEDYNRTIQESEDPFKVALAAQDEQEAQAGTAFSSERNRREGATLTERSNLLGDAFRTTERGAQDLLRGYESKVGTDKARSITLPTISQFSASRSGYTPTTTRSIDPALLGGISYGTVGGDRETAIRSRANELEKTYRMNRVLDTSSL